MKMINGKNYRPEHPIYDELRSKAQGASTMIGATYNNYELLRIFSAHPDFEHWTPENHQETVRLYSHKLYYAWRSWERAKRKALGADTEKTDAMLRKIRLAESALRFHREFTCAETTAPEWMAKIYIKAQGKYRYAKHADSLSDEERKSIKKEIKNIEEQFRQMQQQCGYDTGANRLKFLQSFNDAMTQVTRKEA